MMFNLSIEDYDRAVHGPRYTEGIGPRRGAEVEGTSERYLKQISEKREQQRAWLPLFVQTQKVVAKHKKCLQVILNENAQNMPYQLH